MISECKCCASIGSPRTRCVHFRRIVSTPRHSNEDRRTQRNHHRRLAHRPRGCDTGVFRSWAFPYRRSASPLNGARRGGADVRRHVANHSPFRNECGSRPSSAPRRVPQVEAGLRPHGRRELRRGRGANGYANGNPFHCGVTRYLGVESHGSGASPGVLVSVCTRLPPRSVRAGSRPGCTRAPVN